MTKLETCGDGATPGRVVFAARVESGKVTSVRPVTRGVSSGLSSCVSTVLSGGEQPSLREGTYEFTLSLLPTTMAAPQ